MANTDTQRKRYIHQLVLETWVSKRPRGMVAKHGPNGKMDNSVNNLSWGTHQSNMTEDWERDGLDRAKMRQILNSQQVSQIRGLLSVGELPDRIAPRFGVSRMTIYRIRNRETYQRD